MRSIELPISRYDFILIAEAPVALSPFPGLTLRGALGHTLRRIVCATRMPACAPCPLRFSCAYPVLFEPYAPPDHPEAVRYARLPTPFTLEVPFDPPADRFAKPAPLSLSPGDHLSFGLTVIGRAREHLPYYLYAIMEMARRGLGGPHQPFRLARAEMHTPSGPRVIYEEGSPMDHPPASPIRWAVPDLRAGRLAVRFATPARLELRDDLVYPVEFPALIQALLHRIRALQAAYGLLPDFAPDPGLVEAAQAVRRAEDHTRWLDLRRYSTRQRTAMRVGGAVGTVVYESPDGFEPFALLLAMGQLLHVGKLASMGLGRMEVIPL
ncbi:CRISPR system precrRNA processing endoribonuclease RAMP protein Cas6 [Thermoflexus sp.]|uniref:CRISPR system precrRNA processing endoribonuclease RAMP protein Cas6 n=1 Tax=Thermoflexus sp. TaxID=1969742 RepID=UPI002ADD65BD|nr:CRISPR system precrRNA processing endoribonuclease RAMP protein Cas6 [Thermoflexus sp.]